KTDFSYRIEARVTDQSNREITGASTAIATRGNFVMNVEPDRYGYTAGQQANFRIQARDYDGKPIATKMRLELLDRERTKTLAGADGSTDAATGDGTIS